MRLEELRTDHAADGWVDEQWQRDWASVVRSRRRRRLKFAASVLAIVGFLSLAYCAVVWVQAKRYQATASQQFDRELATAPDVPVAPRQPAAPRTPVMPRDGGLLGRLEIPRLHVSVMVVEGATDGDLRRAVGHIPGTALPGQPGNVGLAGHRDTYFRPLRGIRNQDLITLRTLRGTYRYRVVSAMVVGPRDVEVLKAGMHDELTLVTCFPFNYVGSAPRRFIVRAEPAASDSSKTTIETARVNKRPAQRTRTRRPAR